MSLPDNSKPVSSLDIGHLIAQLSAHDKAARELAAREIFALGLARARQCVSAWLADPDVAGCFVFDKSRTEPLFPRATVGIAVEPASFAKIRELNASPRLADVPPDQDAQEFEIGVGETVRLDILTTRDRNPAGAIARFLEKHGAGIQQVELSVSSLGRATHLLSERFGLSPIYPQARVGADATRVNFFLVPAPQGGKLLIELVEETR